MNRIFDGYKSIAQDYDRSFREFDEYVDCGMAKTVKNQQRIQHKNDQIRYKALDKFKRLGL